MELLQSINNFSIYFLQNHLGIFISAGLIVMIYSYETIMTSKRKFSDKLRNILEKIKVLCFVFMLLIVPIIFLLIDVLQIYSYGGPIIYLLISIIIISVFVISCIKYIFDVRKK